MHYIQTACMGIHTLGIYTLHAKIMHHIQIVRYALYTDCKIYRLDVLVHIIYRLAVLNKHALHTNKRTKDTNRKTI